MQCDVTTTATYATKKDNGQHNVTCISMFLFISVLYLEKIFYYRHEYYFSNLYLDTYSLRPVLNGNYLLVILCVLVIMHLWVQRMFACWFSRCCPIFLVTTALLLRVTGLFCLWLLRDLFMFLKSYGFFVYRKQHHVEIFSSCDRFY